MDMVELIELLQATLLLMLKIAAPILAAGVAIGLVISVFQSVTSIQDQTLSFVPKIAIMVLVAVLLAPWIVSFILAFAQEMFRLV